MIAITCGISSLRGWDRGRVSKSEFEISFMNLPMNAAKAGAELVTLWKLWNEEGVPEKESEVYLLVSDTRDGRLVGELLTRYLKERRGIEDVEWVVVKGLDPSSDEVFYKQGLLNLVKKLGDIFLSKARDKYPILLPVGGFKQSSTFAVLTAQMLSVPAYFLLSADARLGRIPPLPITIRPDWLKRKDIYRLLTYLEDMMDLREYEDYVRGLTQEDRLILKILTEIELLDGKKIIGLSPMGMMVLYSIKGRSTEVFLRERVGPLRFQSSASEEHSKKGIIHRRLRELFEGVPFVTAVRVTKYSQSERKRPPKVTLRDDGTLAVELDLGKDGMFRFIVETTAETERELLLARQKLQEYLKESI